MWRMQFLHTAQSHRIVWKELRNSADLLISGLGLSVLSFLSASRSFSAILWQPSWNTSVLWDTLTQNEAIQPVGSMVVSQQFVHMLVYCAFSSQSQWRFPLFWELCVALHLFVGGSDCCSSQVTTELYSFPFQAAIPVTRSSLCVFQALSVLLLERMEEELEPRHPYEQEIV